MPTIVLNCDLLYFVYNIIIILAHFFQCIFNEKLVGINILYNFIYNRNEDRLHTKI